MGTKSANLSMTANFYLLNYIYDSVILQNIDTILFKTKTKTKQRTKIT